MGLLRLAGGRVTADTVTGFLAAYNASSWAEPHGEHMSKAVRRMSAEIDRRRRAGTHASMVSLRERKCRGGDSARAYARVIPHAETSSTPRAASARRDLLNGVSRVPTRLPHELMRT